MTQPMIERIGWSVLGLLLAGGPLLLDEGRAQGEPAIGAAQMTDERMADEAIQARVEQQLRLDDRITWDNLKVSVQDGQVSLFGMVKSEEEKGWASKAASTVPGVTAVDNRLLVEPSLPRADESTKGHVETDTRDRVLEGPEQLEDRQILP